MVFDESYNRRRYFIADYNDLPDASTFRIGTYAKVVNIQVIYQTFGRLGAEAALQRNKICVSVIECGAVAVGSILNTATNTAAINARSN